MARERMQFDEAAMQKEYGQNLEEAKSGKNSSFGIFKDLPDWDFFKFESGKKYTVRFVPWAEGGDVKKPRWFLKIPVHKYVGPQGNARDYACLAHVGRTCPLCTELDRKASFRYFYNIRYKNDANQFVPAIAEVNVNFHDALCKVSETTNPDTGMVKTIFFMSPNTGAFVGFAGEEIRKGDFKWIEPSRVGFGEPSKIEDKWFDEAVDLHTHVRLFSADQLGKALYGQHPDTPDTGLENTNVDVTRSQRTSATEQHTETEPVAPVIEKKQDSAMPPDMDDPTPASSTVPVEEPSAPETAGTRRNLDVKTCSKGFPFGSPEHAKQHKPCETCNDAEYNECVQIAATATDASK